MVADKQRLDPLAPRELVPTIPDEWNDFERCLLRREPKQRLAGPEFLRRLGSKQGRPGAPLPASRAGSAPLVGREKPLQASTKPFEQ